MLNLVSSPCKWNFRGKCIWISHSIKRQYSLQFYMLAEIILSVIQFSKANCKNALYEYYFSLSLKINEQLQLRNVNLKSNDYVKIFFNSREEPSIKEKP